jgi:sigma-B regulation protein RsbQ
MGISAASLANMSVIRRNNINLVGTGRKTMLFAHGYGCDQIMWRFLVPAFQNEYRLVLFDHVGAGKSDLSYYSREKYGTLNGYADDMLEIIEAVSADPVTFVGHSVSGMLGCLPRTKSHPLLSNWF